MPDGDGNPGHGPTTGDIEVVIGGGSGHTDHATVTGDGDGRRHGVEAQHTLTSPHLRPILTRRAWRP